MSCLAISLTLISAFVSTPPAAADQGTQPVLLAQATPEITTPPPVTPSAQTQTAATPAPGYVPPPPPSGGLAPQLKGPSVWGILPYAYYGTTGIGVGGRFVIPLSIPPLLVNSTVRDAFALEFGADYLHWSISGFSVNWFLPSVGIMWDIWLNSKFALYPKFSLGYYYAWVSGLPSYVGGYGSSIFWDFDAGALYKLDNGLTLRAELGYAGLKVGVGWLF